MQKKWAGRHGSNGGVPAYVKGVRICYMIKRNHRLSLKTTKQNMATLHSSSYKAIFS
jgi:hypothetical protein